MKQIDQSNLLDILSERLSLADMRELCLHLGIDHENLAGDGKRDQILALIRYLNRRERLPDLIAVIEAQRPDIPIAQLFKPETAVPPAVESIPAPAAHPPPARGYATELAVLARFKSRGNLLVVAGGDFGQSLTGVAGRQDLSDAIAAALDFEKGRPLPQVALEAGLAIFLDELNEVMARAAREPQLIHSILAGLVIENRLDMIVSLAYDNLLDKAFEEAGHPAHLVVDNANLRSRAFERPLLIQLYGEWRQPRSLVITEQDINQLLRGQLPDKRDIVDLLRTAFRQKAVLFVGYDLRDTAVNALLDELTGDRFTQPAFAVWSGLTAAQTRAWLASRNLTVIDANPIVFLQTLLDA